MKRIVFTLIASSFALLLHAQITPLSGSVYEVVGRNLQTNRDIVAYKETFDETIFHVNFDTVTNTAMVMLWNPEGKDRSRHSDFNCRVAYYDLVDHEVKWWKSINALDDKLSKQGNYLLYRKDKTLYLLDLATGAERFTIGKHIRPFLYSNKEGWLICSTDKALTWGAKNFRKIDLNTNKVVWQRKLNTRADLEAMGMTDDSTVLFVGEGLHAVNLNDGTGWDYALGTEEVEDGHPILVRSKPLVDSSFIYMAGRKWLVKLDHQGREIWKAELPDAKTSHSTLGIHDSCVLLVNKGYAEYSLKPYFGSWRKWGRPFLAAFNANTGETIYMRERMYMADYALDVIKIGKSLYVLFGDRMGRVSVERYFIPKGNLMKQKDIAQTTIDKSGPILGFVGPKYYTKADSILKPLRTLDTLGVYLEAKEGIIHIDANLMKADVISFEDLYVYNGRHGDLRFFSYHNKIIAVDPDYREVATFDFHDIYCTESEMYSIKDKKLYIIKRGQMIF